MRTVVSLAVAAVIAVGLSFVWVAILPFGLSMLVSGVVGLVLGFVAMEVAS